MACLLLYWQPAYAQLSTSPSQLPTWFIPKSPAVAALERFDSQQLVNLPTGGAQLAVPLVEISAGSLHLPVSLAYAYTGLQVYQPRELIGLGWSLQADASITLQINGVIDNTLGPAGNYNVDSFYARVHRPIWLKNAFNNDADTGPDVYNFSLPGGLSGHFVMRDTTVVLLPKLPVRIRSIGQGITKGFEVTTEEGIHYQFQAREFTTPNRNNFGAITSHVSAWHLTRMISASGADTLRCYYSAIAESAPQQCASTAGQYFTGTYTEYGIPNNGALCGSTQDYSFHNTSLFITHLQVQYLDSIVTRDARLLFKRTNINSSQDSLHALRRIQLLSTIGKRREIKRVDFYQSKFTGGQLRDFHLRLDSLQESANGLTRPPYRFSYNQDADLPTRSSAAKDYWGYANGATGNGDYLTSGRPALLADPRLGALAAQRLPSYAFAKLGALEQVSYPTGGQTRWEYEPGTMQLAAGDELPGMAPPDSTFLDLVPLDGATYDSTRVNVVQSHGTTYHVTSTDTVHFRVLYAGTMMVYLNRMLSAKRRNYKDPDLYRDFNIWRVRPTGDTLITNSTTLRAYTCPFPDSTWHCPLSVMPGEYVAQVYCEPYDGTISLFMKLPPKANDPNGGPTTAPGPGVRVHRTTTTTPGAPPLIRTYTYTVIDSTATPMEIPSGSSLLPQYGAGFDSYVSEELMQQIIHFDDGPENPINTKCQFVHTSSDNQGLGNEFSRYSFYYTQVKEEIGQGQGTTISYYMNLPQQFNDVVLSGREFYQQDPAQTSQQRLVQKENYTYGTDSTVTYPMVRVRRVMHSSQGSMMLPGTMPGPATEDVYAPEIYEVRAGFVAPVLTEHISYDAQNKPYVTTTSSTYRAQQLYSTRTRSSTGWDTQLYKYLREYAPTATITALRGRGFNPVIEAQAWHRPLNSPDSVLAGAHLTLYHPQWRAPASTYQLRLSAPLAGPDQQTQLNGLYTSWLSDSHYERRTTIQYDPTGEIIQQQPAHGPTTSYLVGYNRTLVIAQVQNAAYNQVAYTSFEPVSTGRWQYDSTGAHRMPSGRTGEWAYQLDGTAPVQRGQLPAGDYELTAWVQGAGVPIPTLSGGSLVGPAQLVSTAPGGWQHYRVHLHFAAAGRVSLDVAPGSTPALLDELRLYPVGARMSSYTHAPLVGETSQTGPDGRTIFYEYDGLGRLLRTRDDQGRILSQQQYHYAGH